MPKLAGPFLQKVYQISQYFGGNYSRYAQYGLAGHDGIDFTVPINTPVFAGVHGVILATGNDPNGYGYYVKIFDGAQDLLIVMAHLTGWELPIKPGFKVNPTTKIGVTGNTGNSTSPHLHLGFADTDSGGNKINRANGYDGWKNPSDRNFLTLKAFYEGATWPEEVKNQWDFIFRNVQNQPPAVSGTVPSPTAPAGPTIPGYTGPTPPPFLPSFPRQTVSHLGNNFRSDDGSTWIFQGSDAERKTAADAETALLIAQNAAKRTDAGVYVEKRNLQDFFDTEGIHATIGDAEQITIKGLFEARYNPDANMQQPWSMWLKYNGRYVPSGRTERIEVRKKPLPPAPAPLPEIPVPLPVTPVPPVTTAPPSAAGTPPATTPAGTEPWGGAKAPTHKNIYNKLVEMFAFLKR